MLYSAYMKNVNYDLLKLLHSKLDNVWRLEKFYVRDAKQAKCLSAPILAAILKDEKKHVKILQQALGRKVKKNSFN